ncbi:amino acid ABC transporter substrate-binding protein, PAAT family [Pseudomonas reinekei]|jgi:polar amino acid transport system substrate-binding protein|uniref:Amino acid ABC transporter substrate-binding protein n=1 Tax=Pseudomonas reinekei TaxID=395598 RepID=A0A1H0IM38_PSERE|nr:transporter substrate-binding domain-containing protein [Pseudomonas reinekei]KAB0486686.1 amino acid ABC transporter substrate-binding protein [Pseudomonas reinekei]OLU04316.1 amino acid ABC transporter substrate-binding protein [Pseudomonas reinekei]SDO32549.1 amino acid ABC transporter substrate-binding protein, PAAT family [Pseudomonas reinekei]
MRLTLGALLLISLDAAADDAPLRFVVPDSWTMPMVHLEHGRPTQGILYDVMISLATQVGIPAEFHVLPRGRVQNAMEHGEVDVRCYAAQSWLPNQSGDYIWSIPLWTQPDLLISRPAQAEPVVPANLHPQLIGTVLGYNYQTLQPLFDAKRLHRDDARNQAQVLEKLNAGRNRYAVSNQWTLDWYNQRLLPQQQLLSVAVLQEQSVGCYVRNDPKVPVQRILRTLLRMKMSGEIDDIIRLYIGDKS